MLTRIALILAFIVVAAKTALIFQQKRDVKNGLVLKDRAYSIPFIFAGLFMKEDYRQKKENELLFSEYIKENKHEKSKPFTFALFGFIAGLISIPINNVLHLDLLMPVIFFIVTCLLITLSIQLLTSIIGFAAVLVCVWVFSDKLLSYVYGFTMAAYLFIIVVLIFKIYKRYKKVRDAQNEKT